MLTTVMRKPMPFCATSALPSSCGGANCDDSAENCGESATTQKPQKKQRGDAQPECIFR